LQEHLKELYDDLIRGRIPGVRRSAGADFAVKRVGSAPEIEGHLTPDQVKARLMKTASKTFPTLSTATDPTTGISYTSYYDIFTVGAGYVDIYAA
jgi:hypothetical protein